MKNYTNEITDKDDFSLVNEAIAVYVGNIDKSSGSNFGLSEINYSSFFENKMLISSTIRHGLPFQIFQKIKDLCPFTEADWADFLNVSQKTLQRNAAENNFSFKPIHSEKIIELAEVTHFGKEVFDTNTDFYNWLNTPSLALAENKPSELLKDSYGKELVMAELNRIDQGIFV